MVVIILSPVPIGVKPYPRVPGTNLLLLVVIILSPVPIGVGSYPRAAVTNLLLLVVIYLSPVPIGVGSYSRAVGILLPARGPWNLHIHYTFFNFRNKSESTIF